MTTIIFIRHAPTVPNPALPSTEWPLTQQAQNLCRQLVVELRPYSIDIIYTSYETKAYQTGKYIAQYGSEMPVIRTNGLHETKRGNAIFYESQQAFRAAVREAIQAPDQVIFGAESFREAQDRLSKAIEQLVAKHQHETIAIVTHGRILAMYLGALLAQSPVTFWEQLQMPAYAVFSWPSRSLIKLVYGLNTQ